MILYLFSFSYLSRS